MSVAVSWLVVLLLAGAEPANPPVVGTPNRPADSAPASAAAQPLRILPWVEVSTALPHSVDECVRGLQIWQEFTDTAIISVSPDDLGVFRTVQERVPGMLILPGITTSVILTPAGLDSVRGWTEVSRAVQAACKMTGSKACVLENENAIQAYMNGKYEMNWDHLREGLRTLPPEILIIWAAAIGGDAEGVERLARLCKTADETCLVRFVDPSLAEPGALNSTGMDRLMDKLRSVSHRPTIPIIYCYNDNRYWAFTQVPEVMARAKGDLAILYPGAVRWVTAARAVVDQKNSFPARVVKPSARKP